MDLRHLRAFCAVAQEMQVTKAAKRLKIAQPALTQQIRLLEKSLGQQLVRPKGRGIELTQAGTFFHREAEAILLSLHNACLKTAEVGRGELGLLRVGVTEGASFNPVFAAALSAFRTQWPGIQLTFSQHQTPDLADSVRNHVLDVAFICPLPDPIGLSLTPLYAESMLLALPSKHRLTKKRTVAIDELKNEPVFLITHGETAHSLESSLRDACDAKGFAPRIAQTVPEFMMALNLVAAGLGLSFIPPYMQSIHTEKIVYRNVEAGANITMETVMAVREEEDSNIIENLRHVVVDAYSLKRVARGASTAGR